MPNQQEVFKTYITELRGEKMFQKLLKICFVIEAVNNYRYRNKNQEKREEECYESEEQQTFPPLRGSLNGGNDDGIHVWDDGDG